MRTLGALGIAAAAIAACGVDRDGFASPPEPPDGGTGTFSVDAGLDANEPVLPEGETRDPTTCAEATARKSYVGCEYWPTVTANGVNSTFDFAAVIANVQVTEAEITITGPNVNEHVTVGPGQVKTILLPWVMSLKGPDHDSRNCSSVPLVASVGEPGGAYHLVSSVPVIAYQFNALQYRAEGGESPDGGPKDWSSACPSGGDAGAPVGCGCFSWSNDASLLLPSTAMTGNYRLMGQHGLSRNGAASNNSFVAFTATQDDTEVVLTLGAKAVVAQSQGGSPVVPATAAGQTLRFKLAHAGDVVELAGSVGEDADLSGSRVRSNRPVQVITGNPCINLPGNVNACDHVEESVLPAETLGMHYVVAPPTGPKGAAVAHNVRFFGNKNGTTLTYTPERPWRCPAQLDAGEVADCDIVSDAFEVKGSAEFGVASFLLGAAYYQDSKGDPSQTFHAAVEQFRTKYIFLAPTDYPVLWADVIGPEDAAIEMDGALITTGWARVGGTALGVRRVDLTKSGESGVHTLTAKRPVGVQIIGFGDYTSFQYPAGLDLRMIAPPPVD